MSDEFKYVLWIAVAYIAARVINNYVSVKTLLGPGV
jgi:hypothetical protein